MKNTLKPINTRVNLCGAFLLSIFSVLDANAQAPNLGEVINDLTNISCQSRDEMDEVLGGGGFRIGINGPSGVFIQEIKSQEQQEVDFNTDQWDVVDPALDNSRTILNYTNGLANTNLSFFNYLSSENRYVMSYKYSEDQDFTTLVDEHTQLVGRDDAFRASAVTYFPFTNELWLFSTAPHLLARIPINSENLDNFANPDAALEVEEVSFGVSVATSLFDHTLLVQYADRHCGAITMTDEGVFDTGALLPDELTDLCHINGRIIPNERVIGEFYVRENQNIRHITCSTLAPKPLIGAEVVEPEPDPDMEVEPEPDMGMEMEPDMEVEPEPDMGMEPEPDMEVEPEPDMGMEPEPDMGMEPEPDMEVELEPDMEAVPEPDMEVEPVPDMQVEPVPDMQVGPEVDMEVDPEDQTDMEVEPEQVDMNPPVEIDSQVDNEGEEQMLPSNQLETNNNEQQEDKQEDDSGKVDSGCDVTGSGSKQTGIIALLLWMGLLRRRGQGRISSNKE